MLWSFRSSHPHQKRHAGLSYIVLPHLCDNLLKNQKTLSIFISVGSGSHATFTFPLQLPLNSLRGLGQVTRWPVTPRHPRATHLLQGVAGVKEELAPQAAGTAQHGTSQGRCRTCRAVMTLCGAHNPQGQCRAPTVLIMGM